MLAAGNPTPLQGSMLLIPDEGMPKIPGDARPANPGLGSEIPLFSPDIIPAALPPDSIRPPRSFVFVKPIGRLTDIDMPGCCKLLPDTIGLYCCMRCCCSSMETETGLTDAYRCTSLEDVATLNAADDATKPVPKDRLLVPCTGGMPPEVGCTAETGPKELFIPRPLACDVGN